MMARFFFFSYSDYFSFFLARECLSGTMLQPHSESTVKMCPRKKIPYCQSGGQRDTGQEMQLSGHALLPVSYESNPVSVKDGTVGSFERIAR